MPLALKDAFFWLHDAEAVRPFFNLTLYAKERAGAGDKTSPH